MERTTLIPAAPVSRGLSCETCKFFEPGPGPTGGSECRRHGPAALPGQSPTGGLVFQMFWPPTRPDLWCGEFQRMTDA
jgi:hypothetical protein